VGAAWAVDREHLVTCAHVVQDAGAGKPGGKLIVSFPPFDVPLDAVVLEEGWAQDEGVAGDLALLQLDEPPLGVKTLPMRSLGSLDGLDFTVYGFPEGYDTSLDTNGMLGKAVGLERVRLEVRSALLVKPGFSGAAVWSEQLGAVVGMLTSRDQETEGRVAFAVPVRAIAAHSPLVRAALQTPLDLDRDRATHWGPRSRGVSSDRDDAGWLFSGRAQVLSELAAWLSGDRPPALRVVTGTPGSGKSAVLARLVTSADRHYRGRIPDLRTDDPTIPPEGAFDITFHASGRTVREFVDHVAALAEVRADNASTLVSALDEQQGRLVLAVDAVDEASEPNELCWLLSDLAARGSQVLVGCRPHLVDRLSDPEPIRLDQPPYLDERDVVAYATRLLTRSAAGAVGRNGDGLAEELAAAADGSFLVAQLTAEAVAASGRVERPFPRNVSDAFERLLGALPDKDKARDLLLPLALSFGDGLPRELWLSGAEALRRRYQPADLDDLLASPAASFLTARLDAPGGRRHRLFHQALTETLTKGRDLPADHKLLFETWTSSLPETSEGHRSWTDAPPYLREHAAEHAAAAGVLDPIVEDAGYLIAAEPSRLLVSLSSVTAPGACRARLVYRHAFDALQRSPPAERASYLEMAARQAGADHLADQIALAAPTRPWSARWARWQRTVEHFTAGRHDGQVWTVAFGELDSHPIALSGGTDGTVRVWDLASGTQRGQPLTGHNGWVAAVAFGELDGRSIALSGGRDGTVRVWDLPSGTQRGEPLTGYDEVWSVAFGELDGRPAALSGGRDGTVRVWDLASGTQRGEPLTGHHGGVRAVAFGQLDGQPIALSASSEGTVLVWDLALGTQRREPLTGPDGTAETVSYGLLDGRPTALSGSNDGTVVVWDLASGTQRGEPLGGHVFFVATVAFGVLDGQAIALSGGGRDGTVRVWNLVSGTQLGGPLTGHNGGVRAVAFGELDGRPIALSGGVDGTVRVWDLASGTHHSEPLAGDDVWTGAVAFGELDSGPIALSGGVDGTVRVWDLASGTQRGEPLTGHEDSVDAIAFGVVDRQPIALSASADGTVLVWNLASGTQRGELTRHDFAAEVVAFGELDGQPIALGGSSDGLILVWSLASRRKRRKPLTGHDGWVGAVAFGELDAQPIALSGGWDGTVRVWNLISGAQLGEPLIGHDDAVMALAFGELHGQPIALSGGTDGTVRVWDLASGTQRGEPLTGHHGEVWAVAFGVLNRRPIALSGSEDGTVRVWDLASVSRRGEPLTVGSSIQALAFTPPSVTLVGANAGLMRIDLASTLEMVR
jgi:WD40 repeat protein